MKNTFTGIVSTAVLLVIGACMELSAVVVVSDDFSGTDATAVRTNLADVGPVAWSGSPGYTYGGSHLLSATTGSGHVLTMNMGAGYFGTNPDLYEMSADVFFNSTSADTRFYTIGFTNGTNASAGANRTHLNTFASTAGLTGQPTIALRADGLVTVADQGVVLYSGSLGGYADGSLYSIKLRLDTTSANWAVNAFVYDYTNTTETQLDLNGASAGLGFIYATNPTMQYVGVSSNVTAADSVNSYMDNFLLQTVLIPEPSTWVMVIAGLAGLALCRVKRRH